MSDIGVETASVTSPDSKLGKTLQSSRLSVLMQTPAMHSKSPGDLSLPSIDTPGFADSHLVGIFCSIILGIVIL